MDLIQTYHLGSQYLKPGQADELKLADRVFGGICPGNKACLKKKHDGNEDALGFVQLPSGHQLLLLADSHYGALASELAVPGFLEHFYQAEGNIPQRLFAAHISLDNQIRDQKARDGRVYPGCATTLISVYLAPGLVNWVSSGDSHLFLYRNQRLRKINPSHETLFLGDSYCSPARLSQMLESQGVTDVVTPDSAVVTIMFLLSQFRRELEDSVVDINRAGELAQEISELSGLPFPDGVDKLLNTWHPINQLVYEAAPRWGTFELKPEDRLLMATDGIDENETGVPLSHLEKLFQVEEDLKKLNSALLEKTAGRKGGDDNLMFLLAGF